MQSAVVKRTMLQTREALKIIGIQVRVRRMMPKWLIQRGALPLRSPGVSGLSRSEDNIHLLKNHLTEMAV